VVRGLSALAVPGALPVVLLAVLSAPPTARAAEPAFGPESAPIRPGTSLVTGGDGRCTANFVFRDDAGRVYLGQAAHCARASDDTVDINPATCEYGRQLPLGTPVSISEQNVQGRLAYSSWATMAQRGETDELLCSYNDFALVLVPAEAVGLVNPSVPRFGGPTGVNTTGPRIGEFVCGWGQSPLWQDLAPLYPKRSVVVRSDVDGHAHWVYSVQPGIPGDSGGPYLDEAGRALGSLSELALEPPGANIITDIGRALAYAAAHSGLKGLRLVPGTAPFVGPLEPTAV
jgi:hypothetical protein